MRATGSSTATPCLQVGTTFTISGRRYTAPVVATSDAIYFPLFAAASGIARAAHGGLIPAIIDMIVDIRNAKRKPLDLQDVCPLRELPDELRAGPYLELGDCQVLTVRKSRDLPLIHTKFGNLIYLQPQQRTISFAYPLGKGDQVREFLEKSGWNVKWGESMAAPPSAAKDPSMKWMLWPALGLVLAVAGLLFYLSLRPSVNIHQACATGDLEQVQKHIRFHTPLNQDSKEEKYGYATPLAIAIGKRNLSLATTLIEAGADVNCRSGTDGEPPLRRAIRINSQEMVDLLLEHGADPLGTNNFDRDALMAAAERWSNDAAAGRRVFDSLRQHGVKFDSPRGTSLLDNAIFQQAKLDYVKYLVERGAKPGKSTALYMKNHADTACRSYLQERFPGLNDGN